MIFKSNPLEETYTDTVFGFHESTHCKLSGINVTLLINLNSQITCDVGLGGTANFYHGMYREEIPRYSIYRGTR